MKHEDGNGGIGEVRCGEVGMRRRRMYEGMSREGRERKTGKGKIERGEGESRREEKSRKKRGRGGGVGDIRLSADRMIEPRSARGCISTIFVSQFIRNYTTLNIRVEYTHFFFYNRKLIYWHVDLWGIDE